MTVTTGGTGTVGRTTGTVTATIGATGTIVTVGTTAMKAVTATIGGTGITTTMTMTTGVAAL